MRPGSLPHEDPHLGGDRRRVAFDGNGNGVAVWTQGADVIARRYTASTNTWSSEVVLDTRSDQVESRVVACRVVFRKLDAARIESYLRREQPYDCAGSAKAEGLGIALIARMQTDDPTSLIGLPLIALTEMLERAGQPVI